MFCSRMLGRVLTLLSLVHAVLAACDRDILLATADQYLLALQMGWAGALENLADNFTNRENNKVVDITSGVMFNGLTHIDHNRSTVDLPACATYSEVIATDYTLHNHYVIGAQLHSDPADNTSLRLLDSVISTNGSWLFNATQTLHYVRQESWAAIEPATKRDTRDALRAAADAYLDMWSNRSAVDAVPWGTPCDRLEGSQYSACTAGIPTNNTQAPNSDRRYVIDESVGSVNVLSVWEHLQNAADSHEFRLEGCKLRYVHSITATKGTKLSTDPSRGGGSGGSSS